VEGRKRKEEAGSSKEEEEGGRRKRVPWTSWRLLWSAGLPSVNKTSQCKWAGWRFMMSKAHERPAPK
jgi:hypothetical protein